MRAGLLHAWPGLSKIHHLKPSDIEDLTPLELESYLQDLEDEAKAQARAAAQAKKG